MTDQIEPERKRLRADTNIITEVAITEFTPQKLDMFQFNIFAQCVPSQDPNIKYDVEVEFASFIRKGNGFDRKMFSSLEMNQMVYKYDSIRFISDYYDREHKEHNSFVSTHTCVGGFTLYNLRKAILKHFKKYYETVKDAINDDDFYVYSLNKIHNYTYTFGGSN